MAAVVSGGEGVVSRSPSLGLGGLGVVPRDETQETTLEAAGGESESRSYL